MKILAISYLFPNGIYPNYGIFVLNRLNALRKYCEIKVINPIPWFPYHSRFRRYRDYDRILPKEKMENIEVHHPRFVTIPRFLKSMDSVTYSLAVVPLALRLKKTFPFDLIDLHWTYPDLPAGFVLSKLTGTEFIVTIRGEEALYLKEFGFVKKIIAFMLRRAKGIITLSDKLRELCVKLGCDEDAVVEIRNGVDTRRFFLLERKPSRKILQIPIDEYVILSVGSLIFGKGFDRIIKALPTLVRHNPNVRLYLIGSEGAAGFYKSELLRLVSELGLGRRVRFVGEVPNTDLCYWYNAADIFCLASRGEGSPNVLLEALACGCPAVATNVGSVPEILSEKFMGEVVDNKDEAIVRGLLTALDREYDRRKIANHMKQFDWDWCARKVVEVYKRVLGNNL